MNHNERFEELAALHALGTPLGAEASEFARHLAECPTCEQLLAEWRETASVLAVSAPSVQPRPEVRERLMAALGREGSEGARVLRATESRTAPWLFAAAAALLLALGLWDDARLRRERERLRSESAELSSRLSGAETALARRDLQVRVLESDDVRVLALGGKSPQAQARGKVFWSGKAKRGVLLAGNLEPLAAGKQYELWVFVKGKPVAAGVFDADASGRAIFESPDVSEMSAAQNFAVTIEPRGGVSSPTGPIILVGT